jgi:hypothetical protein
MLHSTYIPDTFDLQSNKLNFLLQFCVKKFFAGIISVL